MAVSGRFTSLVNRLRFGQSETPQMTEAELIAAIQAATAEEFGESSAVDESSDDRAGHTEPPQTASDDESTAHVAADSFVMAPRSSVNHLAFLGAVAVGGFFAALQSERFNPTASLQSMRFSELTGWSWPLWLLGGGVLVGFGTRMAGGCTSGHGLCGVSRWQKGSLVATACFFGTGIGASMLLGCL
jgi:hypothetical protein